jgi:hypothetical protein
MDKVATAANKLAEEWLEMMSANGWPAHASGIRRRAPYPYGETTSLPTEFGLMDVSDSYEWVEGEGGDIRLTIEVYGDDLDQPLTKREQIVRRAA